MPTNMFSSSDLYSTDEESKKKLGSQNVIYLQGHTSSMKKNLDNVISNKKASPVKVR